MINDADCQSIIQNKIVYYRPIIANTIGTASKLHEKLRKILKDQPDGTFAKYILEIVGENYTLEEKGEE